MTDTDIQRPQIFFSFYKGIYFRYRELEPDPSYPGGMSGIWTLSDTGDGWGICRDFNADTTRLDQCIEEFKLTLELVKNIVYTKHFVLTMDGSYVQRCLFCGEVISDYRNTMSPAGTPPPQGVPAGNVYVSNGNPRITTVADMSEKYKVIDCREAGQ